jgi:hypothetical protein
MPGLIVCELVPERLTDEVVPPTTGTGRLASGSLNEAAPVVAAGLTCALPLSWALPTNLTPPGAEMIALPPADSAEDEVESTATIPATLSWALPERVRAPAALPLRR